jgi:hypothetical protein
MAHLTVYNLSSSYTIPRHMAELVFNYYYFNACSTNQICECAIKPLLEWQTIQLLIENGTKRQHAIEQISLIPIKNRGELRTQMI